MTTAVAARGSSSTRELPFEGTPVLSDDEFERASEEIASIAADRQPVLV